MKTITKICAVCAVAMSAACNDNTPEQPGRLAIEGWIDSGGYPVVLLTQSLRPSTHGTDVVEAMVKWGKVTITDGIDTMVMTGGMDYTMLPPYSYRSYAMEGVVGRTYTIIAEYGGQRVTARSTILPAPKIDEVVFTPVAGNDSLCSGRLVFTPAESADSGRYVAYTRVRNRETRHYPGLLGNVSTAPHAERAECPLMRGRQVLDDYQANFVLGDTLDIILARVDDAVYRFWDAYQNTVYFGQNVFLSTSLSPVGNVEGGYGVFSARGVDRRLFVVKNGRWPVNQ